jgi:hypothetical protein
MVDDLHSKVSIKTRRQAQGDRRELAEIKLKDDSLFKLRPVKFKKKIRSSEIDRFLYHAK